MALASRKVRPSLPMRPALAMSGIAGLVVFSIASGGRRPFVPNDALWAPLFWVYFFLLICLLSYVLFGYRQCDSLYPYGWKALRKQWHLGRKLPAVGAVAAIPAMAAPLAWFLLMPTEVALGIAAEAVGTRTERLSATCTTSYRNRMRGPVNELLIEGQREIKLFGFDYLCGNRVGAPVPDQVRDVVLVTRPSQLGLWVTHVEPAR